MNCRQKLPPHFIKNLAYRQAFARLAAALAKNTRSWLSDVEKIDHLRLAVFGCLPGDGPGEIIIPK